MIDTVPSDEAIGHLRRMLQIDTTNPPGNELALARYLDATLAAEDIETRVLQQTATRGAVVARLRGNGRAAPLLIMAHMDVVGVEREAWSTDPFGGEIREGAIHGRGAIDDKGMLAANLMAMLCVKRELVDHRIALDRDLIFAATADEESGGEYGLEWIIDRYPELIRAEYAFNEGGRIRVVDGQPLYAAVQTTEKVSHVVTVTARGPGGHAAIPLLGNPVARLARALAAIAAHQEPIRLLPTVREFFARVSDVWPEPDVAQAMREVASSDPGLVARGCSALCRLPMYDAVLRSGISATMLDAGTRFNVIPTEATATLSIRTLPGDSIDDLVTRLRHVVADDAVTIEIVSRGVDAPPSDHTSPMFDAIRRSVSELDSRIVTVPYLSTGATESAHLRAWGVQTYGLLPFPLDIGDESRMHGHDERLPLGSFGFGVRLVTNVVRRMLVDDGEHGSCV